MAAVRQHDNSFFGDPVLFRLASGLSAPILPELAELGAYAASLETENRARLLVRMPPFLHFYNNDGTRTNGMDVHPAYHSLLTRARHAGIASSLYEETEEETKVRHQARAIRLILLSGVECATLQELCLASAALGILHCNSQLCAEWKPLLISHTHDPMFKPYAQKQGASLGFAVQEPGEIDLMQALPLYEADATGAMVVRLYGRKMNIGNPLADGFLVSAMLEGEKKLFLVPRLLSNGSLNGIHLLAPSEPQIACGMACADLSFTASLGWRLHEGDKADSLLQQAQTAIEFDRQLICVGMMRRGLRQAVDQMRHKAHLSATNRQEMILQARILADSALDLAAATLLVLRIEQARDRASSDIEEAALVKIGSPLVGYWLTRITKQIIESSQLNNVAYGRGEGNFYDRATCALATNFAPSLFVRPPTDLLVEALHGLHEHETLFRKIVAKLATKGDPVSHASVEVLQTATQMSHQDPSVACLLAEQFCYLMAAISLRQLDMEVVTSAFINSRLAGQWRSAYGVLSLRFNPTFILETLYPSA